MSALWPALASTQVVRVETSQWPGYTNEDYTGVYFDYLRLVLQDQDYRLQIRFTHLARAWKNVQRQQADLTLGVTQYDAKQHQLLTAELPFDADHIVAIYDAARIREPLSIANLSQYSVSWQQAYNYGSVFNLPKAGYEAATSLQALSLIKSGRIDVYLAEAADMSPPSIQAQLSQLQLNQVWLKDEPVFVAFSPSPEGRSLKAAWDNRVPSTPAVQQPATKPPASVPTSQPLLTLPLSAPALSNLLAD